MTAKAYVMYNTDTGRCIQSGYLPAPRCDSFNNLEVLSVDEPINPDEYQVIDGQLVAAALPEADYQFSRYRTYGDAGHQLGLLWHDIDQGLFGGAAKTGQFYQHILAVKQQLPKPE